MTQPAVKPFSDEDGGVFLYVQPFSRDADRIRFSFGEVSAVRDDGREFPLPLTIGELVGSGMNRQRRICRGELPPGNYTGFSFTVTKATLKQEEGEATLLVPEKPVRIEHPFTVVERKSSVFFLVYHYADSVHNGFDFTPSFSFSPPPKPIAGVEGFVSNAATRTITVFDKNSMQVVGLISTGRGPKGIALDTRPGRVRVFAAISGDDSVEVFDASTLDRITSIRLKLGDSPQGAAITPDGKFLLTSNAGSNTVSVIDTGSMLETARIPVGNGPGAVLVDRFGRRAYAFNTLSSTISVIDIQNRALVTSFATELSPIWGQFSAKGDRLYVICEQSPYMTVFDPYKITVLSRIYVGIGMKSLKVDPATDMIYAGREHGGNIELYDPVTLLSNGFITTGEDAAYLTIDNEGNNLWALNSAQRTAQAVNLVSGRVVSEIDAGDEPFWMALTGER